MLTPSVCSAGTDIRAWEEEENEDDDEDDDNDGILKFFVLFRSPDSEEEWLAMESAEVAETSRSTTSTESAPPSGFLKEGIA